MDEQHVRVWGRGIKLVVSRKRTLVLDAMAAMVGSPSIINVSWCDRKGSLVGQYSNCKRCQVLTNHTVAVGLSASCGTDA